MTKRPAAGSGFWYKRRPLYNMEERGNERLVSNKLAFKSKNDEEKHVPPATYGRDEEWVQEYMMQFGNSLKSGVLSRKARGT